MLVKVSFHDCCTLMRNVLKKRNSNHRHSLGSHGKDVNGSRRMPMGPKGCQWVQKDVNGSTLVFLVMVTEVILLFEI